MEPVAFARDGLTPAHFLEMAALERRFYGDEYITPADEAFAWYRQYPFTTLAALQNGRMLGFVNLFPVAEPVFRAIEAGRFNDSALTLSDVADPFDGGDAPLWMFLCCIALAEDARGMGLSRALLSTAARAYAPVSHRIRRIAADAVTPAGARFLERHGLTFQRDSDHGTRVYAAPYGRFLAALLEPPRVFP